MASLYYPLGERNSGRRGEARAGRQRELRGVQTPERQRGHRGASAARPAARWRGEVELLDALDEAVVDEGLREARIDLLVHGVQLLVALRRVGGEHAHAPLTLVRVRGGLGLGLGLGLI